MCSDSVNFPSDRLLSGAVKIVESSGIEHQPQPCSNSGGAQCRDITFDKPHVHVGLSYPLACTLQSFFDDVYPRDLPTTLAN